MKIIITTILLAVLTTASFAQKVKLVEGNLGVLKDQSALTVEFEYHNMIVGKDKKEAEYIEEKKKDFDAKEPGRGDKWEKAWIADRGDRFEPQFRELFAKHSGMSTVGENNAYTLIFHTTRTEPGWNVGVMRVPAFIDAEVLIVETKNRGNVIAKITVTKAPGRDAWGLDFETGLRLQEAYAKSGKEVGAFLKKNKK